MKQGSIILIVLTISLVCSSALLAQGGGSGWPDSEIEYIRIRERPFYRGADWLYDYRTLKLVGYAPWDSNRRRWTLFSLEGQYKGFIQASTGEDGLWYFRRQKYGLSTSSDQEVNRKPRYFTQYLLYDSHNTYTGLFVRRIGGRPATPELPYGELGGQLEFYRRGDVKLEAPSYQPKVDPLRRMKESIEVKPLDSTQGN